MITDILIAILIFVNEFVVFTLSVLGTITFPASIVAALTWMFQRLYMFDWIIPADSMVQIALISIAFIFAVFSWRGLQWLIGLFRGN